MIFVKFLKQEKKPLTKERHEKTGAHFKEYPDSDYTTYINSSQIT